MNSASVWLDPQLAVSDFEKLRAAAQSTDPTDWLQGCAEYRGPVAPVSDEPWCIVARNDAEEQVQDLLFRLINYNVRSGELKVALNHAKRAAELDPLAERPAYAVVRLEAMLGKTVAAQAAYIAFDRRLQAVLNTHPSKSFHEIVKKSKQRSLSSLPDSELPVPHQNKPVRRHVLVATILGLAVVSVAALAMKFSDQPAPTFSTLVSDFSSAARKRSPDANDLAVAAKKLAAVGEAAYSRAYTRDEAIYQSELENSWSDIDRIMRWSFEHDPQSAVKFGGSLERYAMLLGHGIEWGQLLLAAIRADHRPMNADLARAYVHCAFALEYDAESFSDLKRGTRDAQDFYHHRRDDWGEAQAMRAQGFVLSNNEQFDEAMKLYSQSRYFYQKSGRIEGLGLANLCLGITGRRPSEEQLPYLSRSLNAWVDVGNGWGIQFSAKLVGQCAMDVPADAQHKEILQESLLALERAIDGLGRATDSVTSSVLKFYTIRLAVRLQDYKRLARTVQWFVNSDFRPLTFTDKYLLLRSIRRLDEGTYNSCRVEENCDRVLAQIAKSDKSKAIRLKATADSCLLSSLFRKIDP